MFWKYRWSRWEWGKQKGKERCSTSAIIIFLPCLVIFTKWVCDLVLLYNMISNLPEEFCISLSLHLLHRFPAIFFSDKHFILRVFNVTISPWRVNLLLCPNGDYDLLSLCYAHRSFLELCHPPLTCCQLLTLLYRSHMKLVIEFVRMRVRWLEKMGRHGFRTHRWQLLLYPQ